MSEQKIIWEATIAGRPPGEGQPGRGHGRAVAGEVGPVLPWPPA